MRKKILLIFTAQNLSKHLYERLGVGVNYKNYNILYWNLLPLINKGLQKRTLDKSKSKNYINIKSFKILRKEIKLLPNNFFYWNACRLLFSTSILDRFLSFLGGKKIFIESELQPDFSSKIKKNYLKYLKVYFKKNKYLLFKKIKLKIFVDIKNFICKTIILHDNIIYFITNKKSFLFYKKNLHNKKIYKIDAPDFKKFKNLRKKTKKNKKKIVFIDQELENPFDQQLLNSDTIVKYSKRDYWTKLDQLFNKIEKSSNKTKITIAAHPRRIKHKLPSKRNFVFYKTLELINKSNLILAHHSLAINYAILLRKPIIFINLNKKIRVGEDEITHCLAKETGSKILYLDNINEKKKLPINFKKIFQINEKKYKNYEENYICHNNKVAFGRWHTILKHLVKIK